MVLLVGVLTRTRGGYYTMDSGRRIRFYPWPSGSPGAPISRQRCLDELAAAGERVLDEDYSSWGALQERVRGLLQFNP